METSPAESNSEENQLGYCRHFSETNGNCEYWLRKDAVPSRNLPAKRSPSTEEKQKLFRRGESEPESDCDCMFYYDVNSTRRGANEDDVNHCEESGVFPQDDPVPLCSLSRLMNNEEASIMNLESHSQCDKEVTEDMILADQSTQTETGVEEKATQTTFSFDLKDKKELSCFTGLDSFELLDMLYTAVKLYIQTYDLNDFKVHKLGIEDQILLTLVKLKQNLPFVFIGILFRVNRNTCARYFGKMIKILRAILENFICTESRELINDNMPRYFHNYITCRYVLDCTEIPVCAPRCIRCRSQTYSHYKGRHTLKILVGVSPSGLITYVSRFFGGKASDKFIFNSCNILNNCREGEAIMVDKGVRIEGECRAKNVELLQPPFKEKGKVFSKEDCDRGRNIAAARVHIERVNERLKNFKILHDEIQYLYLSYMNDIVMVISAIVNLSAPILDDKRFVTE